MTCAEGTEPAVAEAATAKGGSVPPGGDVVARTAAFTVVAVALACLPGLRDEWIAVMPSWLRQLLPAWMVWGTADAVLLPKMVVTWVLSALVFCSWAWKGFRVGGAWPRGRRMMVGGSACFLMCLLVSLCLSSCRRVGWEDVAAITSVLLTCMIVGLTLSTKQLALVLGAATVSGVLVAFYALAQHVGWDLFAWAPPDLVRERSIGTMGNPDFLAAWLVGLLPWAVLESWRIVGWRGRLWCGASAALVVAIVFSFTRAAWVALAVECVVGWALTVQWRHRGRSLVRGWFPLVTIVFVGAVLGGVMLWVLRDAHGVGLGRTAALIVSPRDESSAVRLALWREASMVASEHPWSGSGPGTFSFAAAPYRSVEPGWLKSRVGVPGDPHNMYLELAASSGIPCLLAWMFTLGVVVRRLWKRCVGEQSSSQDAAVLVGLVGLLVAHFFVRMLLPSQWLLWLFVAWMVATDGEGAGEGSAWQLPGRAPAMAGIALGLVLLAVLGGLGLATLRGEGHLVVARDLAQEGLARGGESGSRMVERALATFAWAEALLWEPRRGDAFLAHGKVLEEIAGRWLGSGELRPGEAAARDAAQCYRLAAVSSPLDPWRRQDLGRLLVTAGVTLRKAGEVEKGQRMVAEGLAASLLAAAMDPHNAAIRADYARECASAGEVARAREAFAESLEMAPDQSGVRLHLARLLADDGRLREAVEQVGIVLQRDPGNKEAMLVLERLQTEEKTPAHGRP